METPHRITSTKAAKPDRPTVSIIVVTFKHADFILPCLHAIAANLKNLEHEVIVVDNHSSDNSCQMIREKAPIVSLIANPQNLGFARAVNQGARVAQGRYLLLMNPDIQVLPGSIDQMVSYMDLHPEVGLLLPRLINPDGSLQFSCRTFYDWPTLFFRRTPLGRIFPNHLFIRRHLMLDWDHNEVREVDWGLGACMILRREALDGADPLDERFFLYFEDVDICFRLKQKGWRVTYYPEAVMVHGHMRQSAQGFFSRAKWEHLSSCLKYYIKNRWGKPPVI